MRFTVKIVDLDIKPHNECFRDFAQAFEFALSRLGHEVVSPNAPDLGRLILFGANDSNVKNTITAGSIVYNAEQLAIVNSPKKLLGEINNKHVVWDYSESNIACLRSIGVEQVIHCPVGYISTMTTIKSVDEDIDVLFYGTINGRRRQIIDALEESGLKVMCLFGTYGVLRDRWIARSKIVLNLHYHEDSVFEIFRCSHLLANRKCVVTEAGGQDEVLDRFAQRACSYASRDEIVSRCLALINNRVDRITQAERGYEEFKKIDLVENVKQALAVSL